jgi:hypothetical protein
MRYDQTAIREAERKAFELLTLPTMQVKDAQGQICNVENKYWVDPINITMPAILSQELPFTNANNEMEFNFSIGGPEQVPGVNNNVKIPQNAVYAIYGLRVRIGEGVNAANRIYRSFGNTPNDDALYNSIHSMKFEQSDLIDKVDGQSFRDVPNVVTESNFLDGMLLVNPVRFITGKLGTFLYKIKMLNPIAGLVLTANTTVKVDLRGAFGPAKA